MSASLTLFYALRGDGLAGFILQVDKVNAFREISDIVLFVLLKVVFPNISSHEVKDG